MIRTCERRNETKRRLSALLLILALCLGFVPGALAAEPEDTPNSPTHLRTNYCDDNYADLTIRGGTLYFTGRFTAPGLSSVSVQTLIGGTLDEMRYSETATVPAVSGETFSGSVQLISEPGGKPEAVHIGYTVPADEGIDSRSFASDRLFIENTGAGFRFVQSANLEHNRFLEGLWLNPADMLGGDIPETVAAQSDAVVGSETDAYRILRLLHDWVAGNIYYDHDSAGDDDGCLYTAPEDVLRERRTVCAGYARLLVDLIRAQGIPAMYVTCGAKSFIDDPYAPLDLSVFGSHAYVEAFANGRWVIMDPTWDSENQYEDGAFLDGGYYIMDEESGVRSYVPGGSPVGTYYFDISLEALSFSHTIWYRGTAGYARRFEWTTYDTLEAFLEAFPEEADAWDLDALRRELPIRVGEEVLVFEDLSSPENGKRPSDWALEECFLALRLGLIPFSLQQNYPSPISRAAFCRAVVNMLAVREGAPDADSLLENHGLTMGSGLFTDTDDPDVCAANLLGIVNGVGGGLFQPEKSISRQEAAAMLMRAAGVMGLTPGEGKSFSDTDELPAWAQEGIAFVSGLTAPDGKAVMGGTGGDLFSPGGDYTVEQAILTVCRLFLCQ